MHFKHSFLFFIVFLYVLIIISGLPLILIGNAAKYAQVGKEILENNDWINLTIAGDAYMQKPPMLFWIGASSFHLFGFSLYSYKIPVILISLGGIYSTFKLGQLLYNRNTGILAAIFWATCSGYFIYHNDIRTDTLISSFIIFSVWMLALYFEKREWYYFLLSFIGIGFAMLTKGPVGLAIPVFAIVSDLIYKRKYKDIFHIRWLVGAIIILIIIIPALIGLKNQFGFEGIKFYFWTNNMGRINGTYYTSSHGPFFYIKRSGFMLAPWIFMAVFAIVLEIIQKIKTKGNGTFEIMILGAIILYSLILSVAKQKNLHYFLPIIPFVFILTAKWSLEIYSNIKFTMLKRTLSILNRIMAITLLLYGILFLIYIFPENNMIYWVIACVLFIGCSYFLVKKSNLTKEIIMLGFANAFFVFILNVNIVPNMMHFVPSNTAVNDFNNLACSDAKLNQYTETVWSCYELFLYSKNPGKLISDQDGLQEFLPRRGEWLYTTEECYLKMRKMNIEMTIMKTYEGPRINETFEFIKSGTILFINPKNRKEYTPMYLVRLD